MNDSSRIHVIDLFTMLNEDEHLEFSKIKSAPSPGPKYRLKMSKITNGGRELRQGMMELKISEVLTFKTRGDLNILLNQLRKLLYK